MYCRKLKNCRNEGWGYRSEVVPFPSLHKALGLNAALEKIAEKYINFIFVVLGIKARDLYMLYKYLTTELHSQPYIHVYIGRIK
jgi:hypothetical protein